MHLDLTNIFKNMNVGAEVNKCSVLSRVGHVLVKFNYFMLYALCWKQFFTVIGQCLHL